LLKNIILSNNVIAKNAQYENILSIRQ